MNAGGSSNRQAGAGLAAGSPDRRGSWFFRPGAQVAKYSAVTGVTTRSNLTYLGDFFLRGVFLIIVMYVFFQLWRTTYGATGQARIAGYSLPEMIWYLAVTEALIATFPRVSNVIDDQVKSGQLAYFLGRPHSYLLYLFATYLGEVAVRLPVNLLIAGAIAWGSVGPPPLAVAALPALLAAILLGAAINFVIAAGIGLLAFWVEDTSSIYLLYSRLLMIFGGMLIPLEVFPGVIRRVTTALPTNLIVWGPARLFVGHVAVGPALWGLLGRQALWLGILGLGLWGLFRIGVKRVNVQGG